jgi:hypothetical protein
MRRFLLATIPWFFPGAALGMSLRTHYVWDYVLTVGLALEALACLLLAIGLRGWRREDRPYRNVETGDLQALQQAHYEAFVATGDETQIQLSMRELRELNLRGLA